MLARADDSFPGYERLEDVVPRGALAPVGPFKSRFGAMFLDQLDAPGPEFEWLISGWLSVGDKSIIGGPSQSGKSFLAIHAGMCIALGREFFGADVKQGLVVYQAGEGARGVKKRIRAWRRHFGVEFDRSTAFVMLQSPVNLYSTDGDTGPLIEEIRHIASQFDVPLRMVVIDTLATAAVGAEENSAKDMGMVMANIARINEATRAHVCLVHHMAKGKNELRGSGAIYAALDSTIYVTRNEETKIRTARLGKQKDDESDLSFQFELMAVELTRDVNDQPITSCVCLPVGVKEAVRREEERKGWRLSPGEEVFMRSYFEAEKRCGSPVPADWDLPAKVRTIVAYEDVKRIYAASNPSDDLSPELAEEEIAKATDRHRDALKKKLQRVRESLTGAGVIGFARPDNKPVVWWTGKPLRAFPQTVPREETPPPLNPDLQMAEIPF